MYDKKKCYRSDFCNRHEFYRQAIIWNLRNIAEDGSVYFPDEINPKKLADFLWNPCKYSCTKEIMYAYICRFAQRRINELYRDIRQKHTVGITISFTDSKILNKKQRQRAIKISNNKAELRRKENCRQLRGL